MRGVWGSILDPQLEELSPEEVAMLKFNETFLRAGIHTI